MVSTSAFSPLKEKDEVLAATCSSLMRARELSNSSVRPSEKYSCSLSPLMFTNGSTAIECGGGRKAAGATPAGAAGATPAEAAGAVGGDAECFVFDSLSMAT